MLTKKLYCLLFCFGNMLANVCFAQQPKLMLPIGHADEVHSVRYSTDGKRIITASRDGTAKIWDALSGKLLLDLRGHNSDVFYAEFSSDGKKIVTASNDATAIIWDAITGTEIFTLKGGSQYLTYASFSPDGTKVVTASGDYTARVWDAHTGKLLADLKRHRDRVTWARFSPDNKKILTLSKSDFDEEVKIWEAVSYQLLFNLKHNKQINSATFSNDGKKILTASEDNIAKIWDAATGKSILEITNTCGINTAVFSSDDKKIVTTCVYKLSDSSIKIWDAINGKLIGSIKEPGRGFCNAEFSTSGKFIVVSCPKGYGNSDYSVSIWDASTGKLVRSIRDPRLNLYNASFSPDEKTIVTVSEKGIAKTWDVKTGIVLADLKGHSEKIHFVETSKDGKKMLTVSWDKYAKIWDAVTGVFIANLKGYSDSVDYASFSPDGKTLVTASRDKYNIAKIWDGRTGDLIADLKGHTDEIYVAKFSPDGANIITLSAESVKIWDAENGALKHEFNKSWTDGFTDVQYNANGKKILLAYRTDSAEVRDAQTGHALALLKVEKKTDAEYFTLAEFSRDGNKIVTLHNNKIVRVWETSSSKLLREFKANTRMWLEYAKFSPDGKKILTYSLYDKLVELWDASTGQLVVTFKGPNDDSSYTYQVLDKRNIRSAYFSVDGKKIIATTAEQSLMIWDIVSGKQLQSIEIGVNESIEKVDLISNHVITINNSETCLYDLRTGKKLYSFVAIDSLDFILNNTAGYYDGTEAARKLLYFTCGTEVIELDQVKDQLWVPNLAERIMKGETINAKTLDDLNICGLLPVVEEIKNATDAYQFKITPRRGGLGETVLIVNGIEVRRYKRDQLIKNGNGYELLVKKSDLNSFFISGKENPVSLKAYTADNAISSRGIKINGDKTKEATTPPNLYAVMVGVSDYKGDELDLKYAAKDATDISGAIANAAKKLLNTDSKEHVFMYNLTTAKERYQLPEKNSIKKVLEEIGKKATANDILLIFFAGHGVMADGASTDKDKKQFYFLTADASKASAVSAVGDVGISTAELTDWMKPQNIKAQKRILIFDACNSGQAIKDLVKIGTGEQDYLAARNDDNAQQIKAIDKLNEKSGLFILSASASNQSAYEMGRYSQGLLTYALLKAIKQQPDILDAGKYLDVSRWFGAAEKTVTAIAKESGSRQDPQIVTNTNFNIGLVDEEVIAKIILPQEKPLFAASNFQNSDEAIADDDLELSKQVNLQLNDLSARSADANIVYVTATNSPDAYSLSGRYTVIGNAITVTVNIKQNKAIKTKFELKGTKDKLSELAAAVAEKAAGLVK